MENMKINTAFFFLLLNLISGKNYSQVIKLDLSKVINLNIPSRVASFSNDSSFISWQSVNYNELHVFERAEVNQISILNSDQLGVKTFDYHPNLSIIAVGNYLPDITIWNINPRNLIYRLEGHTDDVNSVQFDPKGSFLASASHDKTVKIWDYNNQKILFDLKGHDDIVRSIKYNSDGTQLYSAGQDGKVNIWNTKNGILLKSFQLSGMLLSMVIDKDDERIIIGNDMGMIFIIDKETEKITEFKAHDNVITSLARIPRTDLIFSTGWDKKIKAWDINSKKVLYDSVAHKDYIFSIDVSPDGNQLISTARDNKIKFWNIRY